MNLMPSRLALHADDLGMNRAVTDGVLRGFRQGLLTSTSVLANAPDAGRAMWLWKGLAVEREAGSLPSTPMRAKLDDPNRPFDLGVHLNLTQGRPLSSGFPAELLDPAGRFLGIFGLFARLRNSGERFQAAIRKELDEQVQVVGDHGFQPTHLNGHQYIEMIPAVTPIVTELLERLDVRVVRVAQERSLFQSTVLRGQFVKWPLACVKHVFAQRFRRRMESLGVAHPDVFFGTAHAGGVDLRLLRQFLASAGNANLVEVGLHPAEASDGASPEDVANGWDDPLADSRPNELRMLLSDELVETLESHGWRLGRLAG